MLVSVVLSVVVWTFWTALVCWIVSWGDGSYWSDCVSAEENCSAVNAANASPVLRRETGLIMSVILRVTLG